MAKRASKRVRGTKTTRKVAPTRPVLPSIVAGALTVGTEFGRFALTAALGALGAAGRPVQQR